MYAGSFLVDYQPETYCTWLIDSANELGLQVNGNPVPWQEINSWMQVTNNNDPWLAATLRQLAVEYCNELRLSIEPTRPAPIENEDIQVQRKTVSLQFHKFLRART